jgi:hypothetical protein
VKHVHQTVIIGCKKECGKSWLNYQVWGCWLTMQLIQATTKKDIYFSEFLVL